MQCPNSCHLSLSQPHSSPTSPCACTYHNAYVHALPHVPLVLCALPRLTPASLVKGRCLSSAMTCPSKDAIAAKASDNIALGKLVPLGRCTPAGQCSQCQWELNMTWQQPHLQVQRVEVALKCATSTASTRRCEQRSDALLKARASADCAFQPR